MAFEEKEIKKPFVSLLVAIIIQVSFVDATNFDCKGKAFYCLNSTHFMICVDLGDGISRTVDDFLIPCPPICTENNNFECEYYTTTTPESIILPSEEMKPITKSALRTFWGDSDSTTSIPFGYKSDDSIKSEKYFNTVSITTTENNILDKVHSTASFIKLTPEETTQHSEEAFTADIPIDIKNGIETELNMQDRINEMLNANMFTTVFIPLTKKMPENVNTYESTIGRESTNTELTPFTVTGTEGYDSHSTTPNSELYFDTISITTLSGSTEKAIFLNHETSSGNIIQENNISMDWNWKDKSEQSSTKYYDTSNILDIFDASTTEKKYEINTYSTRNTISTTAGVDISLNNFVTTTNLEIQLPFKNLEIPTNQDEGNTQSLISDFNLKVLETTQSTDKTWHEPLTNIYQLEDTTKSYGIKKKVRTNIFKNKKKDKEKKLDIFTTDSESLHGDFSTRASDTIPPDIYLKTTVLEATERSNSEITTQLQDFLNKKRLFSTIKGDCTSNSNDVKDELTTDLVGTEINIMGVKVIKQPQPNFQIKNRVVLDTDEMFTKVSTISATKDYYTFEKGDTESTIENDVTTSSQNLLFSVESTTSSYVSDDEVSNNISEVLNNKTKDKIAFNSVEIMWENNVEIFPLSITTEAEENMTYNISGNNNNILPIKLLNTHNKSTVNPTVYETSAVTENIINILTFSNVDLLENNVTSKDPLLISTRFDDLNADTVTDNFKHDIEYEETTNSKEKIISNVTNDSLLLRSFENIKETKTNNANILNVTHEKSVIDLPVKMGLNNYEVITTESGVLPTQINIDDSYLNLSEESEINNETRENNLLITEQKPAKTISEHNLRSDIDDKYYFGDQLSRTDIYLNTELNVPTVEPVMFTSKGQTLKVPFEKKSTLFFFTTEINSFDKEKQFDATTTATLLKDSYMLTTPENTAKLETIQENVNEKITTIRNEDTRVLPDMLGTDVTFTEQVYMAPHTSEHFNIINKKITSDKPAYDTLFQNNTVTDGYYKNEKGDSKTSLDILLKIDNVTKLTNNYSSYNFTPNYIVKDKQDILVTDFDSQIIKSDSKSLRKYPSTFENTDSSTSLYSTAKIGFVPMLKLSTVMYDKTKQINELNTLKDELISIRPTMNNSQDTTVVYNKEDKEEARESNKMIQDFDYKIDISQVTVSYNGFATPLNEVKEITTPDKLKLFVKHTINTDEYSTAPYQIKENNSDLKQNKNISDNGQPPTSDVNLTLTDNNLFISPQSKDPQVKLLTLISNEKAVNSDIILSNNQNKNKKMRPRYDLIGYVLNRSTEIPPMIPVYEKPNSDVETDKTSKIIIPEIEENNSKIKTNVSLIHLELHQNYSLLSSTSKIVDKFSTTGMHNGSTVNPGSIRVFDMVTAKKLSDNNSNIQKQHETKATQPEKINMFSYKKNETNPVKNKNITRHFYVTSRPVNLKAIHFNCLNRRSGKYSDHNNCQRFYICVGRLLPIVGQCPINTVFSEILKQCTHNFSHCIRNNQFQCITSGRFSDMWARDTYYICVKSNKKYIRFKVKCQKGYYLNRTSITCMEDNVSLNLSLSKDSYSTVSSSGSADSRSVQISSKGTKNEFKCVKQGIFPDPNDCKKYYICKKQSKSEFRRKKKKCDSDEVFHKRKRKCVDEESYECTT